MAAVPCLRGHQLSPLVRQRPLESVSWKLGKYILVVQCCPTRYMQPLAWWDTGPMTVGWRLIIKRGPETGIHNRLECEQLPLRNGVALTWDSDRTVGLKYAYLWALHPLLREWALQTWWQGAKAVKVNDPSLLSSDALSHHKKCDP